MWARFIREAIAGDEELKLRLSESPETDPEDIDDPAVTSETELRVGAKFLRLLGRCSISPDYEHFQEPNGMNTGVVRVTVN